jgi:hypothetical protein
MQIDFNPAGKKIDIESRKPDNVDQCVGYSHEMP